MKFSIRTSLVILTISISTISCTQEMEKNAISNTENQKESAQSPDFTVKMNDGSKWVANSETTDGIKSMMKIMDSFDSFDNIEAYSLLSEDLQVEFKLIFKNCTMKGEAHNQLHNFLVPMKEMFIGINSEDLSSRKSNYDKLREHLDIYQEFFK